MNRRLANEYVATELLQAHDAGRVIANPSHYRFGLNLGRAYQIGRMVHQRLVERGFRSVGRKIGFTNRAMWEKYQVTEPIWAHMYAQTVHFAQEGHARVALEGMVAPRLEPEIVLKLRHPVSSGNSPAEDLARCVEWAAIGFEIVDSHFADWQFRAAEAVADFGVHAALVVGNPWHFDSEDPRQVASTLQSLKITLRGGKNFLAEGEGRNALGSPLLALGSLTRTLAVQTWAPPLMPGEIITTGTLTSLPSLNRGESYRAEVAGAPLEPLQLELIG